MNVSRVTFPDGNWFERHTDPSRKQLKEIERLTRAAFDTDTPSMLTEDALVLTFVTAWSFTAEDGKPLSITREALDSISGAKTQPLLEDLAAIYDRARGANPVHRLDATWATVVENLAPEDREKMAALHKQVFEVLDPNTTAGKG